MNRLTWISNKYKHYAQLQTLRKLVHPTTTVRVSSNKVRLPSYIIRTQCSMKIQRAARSHDCPCICLSMTDLNLPLATGMLHLGQGTFSSLFLSLADRNILSTCSLMSRSPSCFESTWASIFDFLGCWNSFLHEAFGHWANLPDDALGGEGYKTSSLSSPLSLQSPCNKATKWHFNLKSAEVWKLKKLK